MLETQVLKINILKGILKIIFWGKEERQKVSEEKVNVKHFVTVLKWCPFPSSGIHVTAQGWEPGELCDRSEAQCIQVSRESWMITSFPKSRRRTGQGGIIMQFRGAVHCNNFLKSKQKSRHRAFQGIRLNCNLRGGSGSKCAFCYKLPSCLSSAPSVLPFLFWCNRTQAASDAGACAAKWSQAGMEWSVNGFSLKFIGHSHPAVEINDRCMQRFNHGSEEMH